MIDRRAMQCLRTAAVCLLSAALFTGAAAAQGRGQGPPPGRGPGSMQPPATAPGPALLRAELPERGPIDLLLERRDSLRLEDAQVRQLEAIAAALQARNRPVVTALIQRRRAIQPLLGMHPRDMTPQQRAQFSRVAAGARPLLDQLQRNNLGAMERVGRVLSAEQKRLVRQWLVETGMVRPGQPPLRSSWEQDLDGTGG